MRRKILSLMLCAAMTVGLLPAGAVTALAAELNEVYTLSDNYISVSVSKKNGGFSVTTVEGDKLKKSDNDKNLLYHDGRYDTSFLTLRVGEGEAARDYLFGGNYADGGELTVTPSAAGDSIAAVWTVAGLIVTQTITLAGQESNESGMVSLSVSVKNESGAAVPVQARLLLDTCLGSRDYGYYQYTDGYTTTTVTNETVITDVPAQLYASDGLYSPDVTAYTVHTGTLPVKAAFGHWSRLAATLFDFEPVATLDFTTSGNEYMTADSAYALYYDLGSVGVGETQSIGTYYGVFSNYGTPAEDSVAVNLTAPVKLALNADRTDFVPQVDRDLADFSVTVDFTNILSDTARDFSAIKLAVQTSGNLRPLSDSGGELNGQDFDSAEPYSIVYDSLTVGQSVSRTLYFEARPAGEATYEKITVGIYDVSQTNGQLSDTYKLGERTAYVLLPGTDNDVPKVNFAAMTPKIVYTSGTRHLFVTVNNDSMLGAGKELSARKWKLYVVSEDKTQSYLIPHANISFNEGVMDVALTEELELAAGSWFLRLEWDDSVVGNGASHIVPAEYREQTASELHFTVSDDERYRNDSYGVLAVVEYEGTSANKENKIYRIRTFTDEEDFGAYQENPTAYDTANYTDYGAYTEIVFVLKGKFTVSKRVGNTATYYTALSKKEEENGKTSISNSVVINDCLDFEDGTMSVYYEDYESGNYWNSAVCIEMDGKIYTNGARTDVWSGKAVFTKLEQDRYNYSLAPYDENGERISILKQGDTLIAGDEENFTDHPICLIWPNRGAVGRTLSGLLFNFAYGQMGIMYDTDGYNRAEEEIGTVVSFAAALDLTFAKGKTEDADYTYGPDTYWSKLKEVWAVYNENKDSPYAFAEQFDKAYKALDWSEINEKDNDWREKEATASVMVRDVLFGCGTGFVGVNFSVGVAINNYVAGLPEIQGTISVNTVNNWAFGIDGKIDLEAFYVEATVSFRSKDNVPVPDELYVFVSGFEPGINIDGFGVFWLTGGGGGIKNLYDTIYSTQKLPPLKLLLSVSFDLLKILECEKATLSVGATGLGVTANGIGVKGAVGLKVIDRIGLTCEWYPAVELQAYINLNLFQGLISGSGYIVLMQEKDADFFFEIFARASLNVPNSIPIVGGMRIGGVDLGINSEKIWGAIDVLFITLGLTYYWGEGSVDFSGGNKAQPTFPELLGYEDIPVGYDEENDRTLYARIGTNTALMVSNLEDDGGLVLMNTTGAWLKSNGEKSAHRFNLGNRTADDGLIQVVFEAESLADAQAKARAITVGTAEGGNDYGLVLYDGTNLETANANVTYDEATGRATFAFTATEGGHYGKTWYMTTPAESDVLLYNVEKIPEVTEVAGNLNGDKIDLTWSGTELAELDQISFYLTSDDAGRNDPAAEVESGYRLGVVTENLDSGSVTLDIPADIPTGDYYVRAVYSKENEVNGTLYSTGGTLGWVNENTPGAVRVTDVRAAGNLQYELTIAPDEKTDGYFVTVYDEQGNVTDFEQVSFDAAESGNTVLTVGGSYETADPKNSGQTITFGLTGGNFYKIGITPYQTVPLGTEGETAVRGGEVLTELVYLPEAVTPTVTFSVAQTAQTRENVTYQRVTRRVWSNEAGEWIDEYVKNEDGSYQVREVSREEETVFTDSALTVTATVSEAVTGKWRLDTEDSVAFTGEAVTLSLADLAEGSHTLTLEGTAADGDGFYAAYVFTVDTLPPQLLLSSPVNGGFFGKDGTVTLTGVTDPDARFTVTCDGKVICDGKTAEELGGTMESGGVFSVTLNIPDPNRSSRRVFGISVSDDVGNTTAPETVTLSHGGLADLQSLEIAVDGRRYEYGNLPVPVTGLTAELTLLGVMSDGSRFVLDGDNVTWEVVTVAGEAREDGGTFTAKAQSQGIIIGKLAVAEGAFRTASVCFGANGEHIVSVSATVGGSVTGGGEYAAGEAVTLTAKPDSGYRFAGWTVSGAEIADLTAETITFTMPERGNVTALARFEPVGSSASSETSSGEKSVYATAGEIVRVKIPTWKTAQSYMPYYLNGTGEKVFVAISDVSEGEVVFLAPASGFYRFGENAVSAFTDIPNGFWAEEAISFCAERGIFNGIGDGKFDPAGTMNRAMFVTVLYRLAGTPKVSQVAGFTDVIEGDWYADAVNWAKAAGVVNGYDDGRFGIEDEISREQMCTMLTRYFKWAGYELPAVKRSKTFTDSASVTEWAVEGVAYCQTRGLINGYPDGSFLPQGSATRAENSAVLRRVIRALLIPAEAEPVRIAFLDSGISTKHLNAARVEAGANFVFEEKDTVDRVGHGTATAGLVLGSEELGLTGVCPTATVIPLVCYDVSETGEISRCDGQGMARAIYAAVDEYQCDIINISMGMTSDDAALHEAIEYALSRGVLVLSAVGNDNLTEAERVYYPAAYEGVIGVGAATENGTVAEFSQRNNVDLVARGVGLETVTNKNAAVTEVRDGTSYACAVVSGLCAAIWTEDPALTAAEVTQILLESAIDIGTAGFDADSGWGIVK